MKFLKLEILNLASLDRQDGFDVHDSGNRCGRGGYPAAFPELPDP